LKALPTLAALAACAAISGALAAPATGLRSQDDRGFSITLVSPTDVYLTGRRTMRIEPIIPRGDAIDQVDFFVDGRLAFIDQLEPYAHEADFGDDIRRHAIEVRALTRQGRRAKVAMISRSADLTEGAAGPVETLSAMVRGAAGKPAASLGVSDFLLREDGAAQSIVHFEGGGAPSSLALVQAGGESLPVPAVNERLASFLRGLPRHHAVFLADDAPAPETPGAAAFSYDLEAVAEALPARAAGAAAGPETLAARLARAAAAIADRRGPRVLLVLAPPEVPLPAGPAPEAEAPPKAPGAAGGEAPAAPPLDPLEQALQAARTARAVLYVVTLGGSSGPRLAGRLEEAALESGGRLLQATDLPELEQALAAIAETLHHRYLISYMPADPKRAGQRRIEVLVLADGLEVEAPRSLVFP
jgi:hypothetical protein